MLCCQNSSTSTEICQISKLGNLSLELTLNLPAQFLSTSSSIRSQSQCRKGTPGIALVVAFSAIDDHPMTIM